MEGKGTWTGDEHARFLQAMQVYPKGPWKAIAAMVGTRTVRQTQTHAQKYREKIARRMRGLRNRNGTLQTNASLRAAEILHQTTTFAGSAMRQQQPHVHAAQLPFPYQREFGHPHHHQNSLPQFPYRSASNRHMADGYATPSVATQPSPSNNTPALCHSHGSPQPMPSLSQAGFQTIMKSSSSPLPSPNDSTTSTNSSPSSANRSSSNPNISPSGSYTTSLTSPHSLSLSYTSRHGSSHSPGLSTKKVVPDFNESMDFFMEMYHYNPETLVVPTSMTMPTEEFTIRTKTVGV